MKKFITLLLVLTGMVLQTMATTLHIGVEFNFTGDIYVHRFGGASPDTWQSTLTNTAKSTYNVVKYGRRWYSIDMNGNNKAVIRWQNDGDKQSVDITGISGDDYYIYVSNTKTDDKYNAGILSNPYRWNYMTFRQNIIDKDGNNGTTWTHVYSNFTSHPDGDTFTFELTKAQVNASSNKGQGIRFRLRNGDAVFFNDAGTYIGTQAEIYPTSTSLDDGNGNTYGSPFAIASSTTTYNHTESTNWYWQISIPSYDYEKIVITAKYVNESGYKWKISADAYVTKTVNGTYQYATLGCSVPLEIVEANGVKAYPLTANASTGKINKGDEITVIPANEGALLENTTGSDKTIRAQVLASAAASASNYLVASGTSVAKVTETGYTNYILANQDEHVGFYMVNSAGNSMGANTAYLHVPDAVAGARAFFGLDDETTAIEAVKATRNMNGEYYNLAGQRVAQPTKGLYIVNGKKVIMK